MKSFRHIIKVSLLAVLIVAAGTLLWHTNAALASSIGTSKNAVCDGVGLTGGNCGGSASSDLSGVVKVIVNILSAVVGIAAVIMIIIAGLRFVSSGGDSSKVSGAKSSLIYAIVGLVVVAMAQIIVHFVIANA